jgi:hypothetical protein
MKNKPVKLCKPKGCIFHKRNTLEARIVKKNVVDQKKLVIVKICFAGRAYMMRGKFGNYWVEYRDPVDLMDHPPNMKIGLCWYHKGQQQVTYDLINQLTRNFL